jgi:DNA adenine methylase
MQNCPHKWLITYDDSEFVRDLFTFANVTPWNLTYGMRNVTEISNQKGKELFISNYDIFHPKAKQLAFFEPQTTYKGKCKSSNIAPPLQSD